MATLFTKIINGEIPCYKVAENEEFFAFLDINPKAKGHTLVIPKREVDYLFDMEDDELARMMAFAKKIAAAIRKAFHCPKVGIAVLGLEVPHAHIHLIPLESEATFYVKEGVQLNGKEFEEVAAAIKKYL